MEGKDNEFSEEYLMKWNAYFYPETNVFINKLGITDYDELKKADAELSFQRLVELAHNPLPGNFDKQHLLAIHYYLFQDLYDWAGKYRTVYMAKNNSYFAPVESIDLYLDDAFNLMSEEIKVVSSLDDLVIFLAKYYVILLNIHPFREGNGRTISEFFSEYVLAKSINLPGGPYELDWDEVDEDALEQAMVLARAFKGPIEAEFRKALKRLSFDENKTI